MTNTYSTGNPIGSSDPRDAYDNKSNFDEFALSANRFYTDRLGSDRKTITGALQDYAAYNPRGEWTTATAYQVNDIWRDGPTGAFYLVLADYTSSASAAADISGGNVVVHQPKDWVVSVNSTSDIADISPMFNNQQFRVGGTDGGNFYYDAADTTTPADGVYTFVASGGHRIKRREISGKEVLYPGKTKSDLEDSAFIKSSDIQKLQSAIEETEYNIFETSEFALDVPVGFPWSPDFSIVRERDGRFSTTVKPENYIPRNPTSVLYVSKNNGSDTNTGKSWNTAFKTVTGALNSTEYTTKTGGCVINIAGGFYNATESFQIGDFGRDTALICPTKDAFLAGGVDGSTETWAQETAPNDSVWRTTFTTFGGMVWTDTTLDDNGYMTQFTEQASIADCQANQGSFYWDGTTLYVHSHDSLEPDGGVFMSRSKADGVYYQDNDQLYCEGITFGLGSAFFVISTLSVNKPVVFNKCTFAYSNVDGLRSSSRRGRTILFDCVATLNGADGFNYRSGYTDEFLEVNCKAFKNGWSGDGANNGTTAHGDSRVIRVNGFYDQNADRNLHDINDVYSWNIGCYSGRSTVVSSDEYESSNFVAGREGQIDATNMWLDMCISQGSASDIFSGDGATIKTRRMKTSDKTIGGLGIVDTY